MNRVHRWLCRSSLWKKALERKILPWALEGIELGDHLLEVGPGPGLTTDFLRQRVDRLTCIEIDRPLADSLQRRLAGTNVTVVHGDGAQMPFAAETFSAAVSLTMLHHVPSTLLQDRLLAEVYRVLRRGGRFAGTDSRWSPAFSLLHLWDTMVMVPPESFGTRLEDIGFDKVIVDPVRRAFRFQALRP
jgi:ubiquinone/menaquinone biosynthesis C-methylase UbiE